MRPLRWLFFFVGFAWTFVVGAQNYGWQDFLREISVSIDEELVETPEWQDYIEELQEMHEHPLNVNTATIEQLQRLPFLTDDDIEAIHAYIYLHGSMQTLSELMLIPSISTETRHKLTLFLYAEMPTTNTRNLFARLRQEVTARMDFPLYYRKGELVEKDGYRGNGLGNRMRYSLSSAHVQFDLHTKKDAGERFFDSHGGAVALKDMGCLQMLVVGDYRISFGEGLVMGNGGWNVKSNPSMRRLSGLRPMTGYAETGFLRGVAATLNLNKSWQVTTFFSRRGQDATLTPEGEVKTLIASSYHRTDTECGKKHNVQATLVGGNVTWAHRSSYVGATGYYQTFSRSLNPGSETYRQIYPRGENFGVVGLHYGTRWKDFIVGGETSFSTQQKGLATLQRIAFLVNARHTLSLVQRYYNEHYYSFHASAMGESSNVQNENGVLLSWQGEPWSGWKFSSYVDFFFQRWPAYGMKHSNKGQELMGKVAFLPNQHHQLSLSYRWKSKERYNLPDPHHKVQVAWDYSAAKTWFLKVQGAIHGTTEGTGYGAQTIVGQHFEKPALRWYAVGTFVHTPSYLSRIYFYEPTLYQSVASSSLFGRCLHAALGLRWTTFKGRLMLEARYGLLRYFDREEQSSGLQTIFSPWKNDLQVLARLRL